MNMKILQSMVVALLVFWAPVGSAEVMPDRLVETTINELINSLEAQREVLKADKQKLYKMVEDVVVPHFEVNVIARLVLAKHWKRANPEQQQAFAEQFKQLLIRTYATALFEYTGKEEMVIKPLRIKDGDRKAKVRTDVVLPGAPPVPVNYAFLKTKSGSWKIYDVTIDGISLVTNYRSSYGQQIQQDGLDALISALKSRNQSLEKS